MHCVYIIIIIIDYLLFVSIAIITILYREMKEELATVRGKESEVNHKKSDLEKQLEVIMMITKMIIMTTMMVMMTIKMMMRTSHNHLSRWPKPRQWRCAGS